MLVSGIEYKLRKLIDRNDILETENKALLETINKLNLEIENKKQQISELEEKLKISSLNKVIAHRFEVAVAKNKIGELVREIDKCIGFMKQ